MAIKRTKTIKDFWPHYRKTLIAGTIAMQIALTIVVLGAVAFTVGIPTDTLAFIVFFVATLFGSIGLNLILVSLAAVPLKNLLDALTHASGELSTVTPPNPNARHFENSGFKPLLQYIYENASAPQSAEAAEGGASSIVEQALRHTKAGVVVMNSDGTITYSNDSAPISIDTSHAKHLDLLFENSDELTTWIDAVKETQVHAEKIWQRVPNKLVGEEDRRIFDICATFEKGATAEVVLVLFDRSDIYQPEDDALDFISFAAHELRGPITVIRGYLDVLAIETEGMLQPDQQELMKRLIVSASRLSGYINNILNASRYDRRHMQLHLVEDSLYSVYDTINDDMQMRASSQNRLLIVNIPSNLPTVAADRSSLSEVMANLIDNAIKYSNEGGIVNISATIEGDFVKVFVEDHGIGIPSSVIGNLFHKFYRSHRSRETVAGTGIGLYICKAIIESHGGTIGVMSAEGQGSVFSFTVPIYETVKYKLLAGGSLNSNAGMITTGGSWIKNHAMYKG